MNVPTFRYMTDAEKFLKELSKEVDETTQLLKKQQKLIGSSLAPLRLAAASEIFDLTPRSRAEQTKDLRKMRHKIDPSLEKIVVPSMKKLESQYNVAEDLYEKMKGLEQAEAQVQMAFSTRRGAEYEALMSQFRVLKEKVQKALADCLQFLADVAQKHVPATFQQYVDHVAELVTEHVIFRDSKTFMYVSVDPEGNLVFTAYIMLIDAANDEGEIEPHLYISIQWVVSDTPEVSIDLNHEYEVPNKLLGQGEMVGSVGEAVKAISNQLEIENFASSLGVIPLALQLKVDPTSINVKQFDKLQDVIKSIEVTDRSLVFTFLKEFKNAEAMTDINAQIYQNLKALMKKTGAKLTMKPDLTTNPPKVTFTINKVAEGGDITQYDFEFLRDKFGLNNTQLRKIGMIINRGK